MLTLGLLGGMSWESSVLFERLVNTEVRCRLGGSHSADLLLRSYDFAVIEAMQSAGRWEQAAALLAEDARGLQDAGAQLLVLCTNTMHVVAEAIEAAVDIPFLHIGDATAAAARAAGVRRPALLGTRYTMEQPFLVDRLTRAGLSVSVPDEPDRTLIHEVIYAELVRGVVRVPSKRAYLDVIDRMLAHGADGVIAGCTEIEMLVGAEDIDVPFLPTTRVHALAAVDAMLADGP